MCLRELMNAAATFRKIYQKGEETAAFSLQALHFLIYIIRMKRREGD